MLNVRFNDRLKPTRMITTMGANLPIRACDQAPTQRHALDATVMRPPYALNRSQAVRRSTWTFMPPA